MHDELLIALTAIIGLAVISHWIAWRLRLPSILLFLGSGILVGPVLHILDIDHVLGELLFPIVSLSIAIILFEGSLTLRFADLRHIERVVWRILSLGALVTWGLVTLLAMVLLGFDFQLALLLGAILVVTGPTVIIPLLRQIRPSRRVASILRWEGIVIDPIGVVLTVLVFEMISTASADGGVVVLLIGLIKTTVIGIGIGYGTARLLLELLRRQWIPDYLENPVTLGLVLIAFTLSNVLQHESGLLTVTVMGIVMANQELRLFGRWTLGGNRVPVHTERILEFKETLQTLIVSSLFIMLSARLRGEDMALIGGSTIIFVLALMLVVRPVMIWLCTPGSPLSWQERVFLSWMAPRGIVAASTASIFGLELAALNINGAEQLAPVVFAVIIGTVIFYSLTIGPLARYLGLSEADPQGTLIVGADTLARDIAQSLKKAGFDVLLVDTNWSNIQQARMEGLRVVYASILSSQTDELVDLTGIGRLLALTSNDEVNTLAALKFARQFGRSRVFQLAPRREERLGIGNQFHGRLLFGEQTSHASLEAQFARGAALKLTQLTPTFDVAAYQSLYNERAEIFFAFDKTGRLLVATADAPVKPQVGMTLVSLIQPEASAVSPDAVNPASHTADGASNGGNLPA
jgi:NhaP-type Na+/H+ or K+/H+ antiporter